MVLHSLVAAVKKMENLPPEVQGLAQTAESQTSQEATKLTHSAIAKLANAREHLQQRKLARTRLHGSWKEFLDTSIARWEQNLKNFQEQDQELLNDIQSAQQTLQAAKETLEQSRSKVERDAAVEEVSDDGAMVGSKSEDQIMEGAVEMANSLKQIKQKVDAAWQVEQQPKKHKTDKDNKSAAEKAAVAASAPSAALQPFGGPGM